MCLRRFWQALRGRRSQDAVNLGGRVRIAEDRLTVAAERSVAAGDVVVGSTEGVKRELDEVVIKIDRGGNNHNNHREHEHG